MPTDGIACGVFTTCAERAGVEPELQFPGRHACVGRAVATPQADYNRVTDQVDEDTGAHAAGDDRHGDARLQVRNRCTLSDPSEMWRSGWEHARRVLRASLPSFFLPCFHSGRSVTPTRRLIRHTVTWRVRMLVSNFHWEFEFSLNLVRFGFLFGAESNRTRQ